MRISILKSFNAVEYQHKPVKEKLLREITVHLFDCDYTSYLKNVNQIILTIHCLQQAKRLIFIGKQ